MNAKKAEKALNEAITFARFSVREVEGNTLKITCAVNDDEVRATQYYIRLEHGVVQVDPNYLEEPDPLPWMMTDAIRRSIEQVLLEE